jgi:hypothetical protein
MDNAIRYRHRVTSGTKLYEQAMTAVVGFTGHKYAKLVIVDHPVRVIKVPVGDLKKYGEEIDYPEPKAARAMLEAGRRMGIRKGAKQLLTAIVKKAKAEADMIIRPGELTRKRWSRR